MAYLASWLPLVRAAAIGWVPVARDTIPPLVSTNAYGEPRVDQKVRINVSGHTFETWRQTLDKYPDTLLGSDEKDYFHDPDTGEYFFDRDPNMFRYVLGYYRTGRIHYPKHECVAAFEVCLQSNIYYFT